MTNKSTYALRRAIVCATMVAGAILAPTAAQATPSNCSGAYEGNGWRVYCGQGTGEFRARVRCYKIGKTTYVVRYGLWRWANGGVASVASCRSGEEPVSGSWQFR